MLKQAILVNAMKVSRPSDFRELESVRHGCTNKAISYKYKSDYHLTIQVRFRKQSTQYLLPILTFSIPSRHRFDTQHIGVPAFTAGISAGHYNGITLIQLKIVPCSTHSMVE